MKSKLLTALILCGLASVAQAETMIVTNTMCNVALTNCVLLTDDVDVISLAYSPSTSKLSEVENDANGVGVLTEETGVVVYGVTNPNNNYHKVTPLTVTYGSGNILYGVRVANRSNSGRGGGQWHYGVIVNSIESPSEAQ